ncbi:MAG: hypothetical protein IKJ55_03815, partial [Clostridia bacterium]|nr:hypothetical protein [Clostridia bacterium]
MSNLKNQNTHPETQNIVFETTPVSKPDSGPSPKTNTIKICIIMTLIAGLILAVFFTWKHFTKSESEQEHLSLLTDGNNVADLILSDNPKANIAVSAGDAHLVVLKKDGSVM